MDYLKIREGFNEGSAVSVNHKALITRALTKYPVDYALFRELLQNSADAQAKTATIQFESASTNTGVAHIHQLSINRLRFSNDGLDFAADDWKRLREIASGNPNETKIGAFGVGFYSVFELTDEPLVHSGDKIMSFRYKGVQLQYNYVENTPQYQKGTLIDIPYKNEGQLPDLVKFIGFLVQSFLLVNLQQINLQVKYGNGKIVKLLSLSKEIQSPTVLTPPAGYNPRSPRKMLNMALIQSSACRISISYLNVTQMPPLSMSKGLFSFGKQLVSSLVTTTGNPEDYTDISFDLTKVDATVDVNVSSSFRKQMIDTLLKPPPKQAVMSLLSFNGTLPSKHLSQQLRAYVFPEENNDAKIFIGFPTKQSTGLKSHLALNQVIPTMERTAIDMSNQFVKDWNCEMLYMAGVMARCAYENELNNCRITSGEKGSSSSPEEAADFIISRFRFSRSAPDAVIGLYIKEGFWKCSKSTLVPTTQGIVPNSEARFAGDAAELLRKTPVVSNEGLAEDLKGLQLVHEVSQSEIAADIGSSPISVELAKKVLAWLAPKWQSFNQSTQVQLLSAVHIKVDSGVVVALGSCQWFHDRSKLPDDDVASHLPPSCLPHELASKLGHTELIQLGLKRLDIMQWAQFRFKTLDRSVAYSVLRVTSNSWPRLPQSTRRELRALFESVACIPTKSSGLKLPSHTYVETVKLFPHLPVIDQSLELPRSWLREIGLRESVDMSFVLEALNGNDLKWTNEDLVAYLVENSKTLKQSDWAILREGQFFAKHGTEKQHRLYRAKDLFAPSSDLRSLGLPTIAFKNWEAGSQHARLLAQIGLNEFPPAELLFTNVSDVTMAQVALRYFVRNYEDAGYSYRQIADFAVIPTLVTSGGSDGTGFGDSKGASSVNTRLAKPSECYRDPELAAFGEKVISPVWEPASARLGIRKRPKIRVLLERVLANPAKYLSDPSHADKIFSYLAQSVGDIGDKEVQLCQSTAFIPVFKKGGVVFEKPTSVFLPYDHTQGNGDGDLLRPLLNTVHASRHALPFFYTIGISDTPTLAQLVEILLDKPHEVFDILKSDDSYEEILVRIESKWSSIAHRADLVKRMKQEPWLLGIKFPVNDAETNNSGGQVSLYRASDLVIVDDVSIFSQFKHKIVTAPQVDALERLYSALGIPKLSQILRESIHIGSSLEDETQRLALQRRIDERLKLFRTNTSKQLNPKFNGVDVSLVKGLEIQRQLPPHSSIVTKTSTFVHPSSKNKLLIVPGPAFDWIDVASAIAKLVLLRPDQDSIVVLEIQLSLDLDTLEKKGYNVEKLRHSQSKPVKKVSIREDNQPPPRLPPVQPSGGSSEKQVYTPSAPAVPAAPAPPPRPSIQSPSSKSVSSPPPLAPPRSQSKEFQGPASQPTNPFPPYKDDPAQSSVAQTGGNGLFNKFKDVFSGISGNATRSGSGILGSSGSGGQAADTVSQLNQGLQRAQRFSSSSLDAPNYVDTPAPMGQDICGPQKVQNIQLVGTIRDKIQLFSTPQRPQPAQDENELADTLMLLCKVFNYPETAINIHRDEDTRSIAFNYNGSLFFNSCVRPSPGTVLEYYYPVMAHELAHNLVTAHNASHSFFTEAYIQATLSRFPNRKAIAH